MAQAAEHIDDSLLVTFFLGDASFGIDTRQVQDVVRVGLITPVHHAPDYVIGIRNLRGRIVTVIDLKERLELGNVAVNEESRIIIIDSQSELIGLLVDHVAEIISIDRDQLDVPPANVHGVQSRVLSGVCKGSDRLVAVLNLDAVLQIDEQRV
jgi:purine-binding chemotaxis protein CheW